MKFLDDTFSPEAPKPQGPTQFRLVTSGTISPELFHERYILNKREHVEVEFEVFNEATGKSEPDDGSR